MTQTKEMTRAEIKETMECFIRFNLALLLTKDEREEVCENCPYIDFCWNLRELINKKPRKYV